MNRKRTITLTLLSLAAGLAIGQSAQPSRAEGREGIETILREYLLKNPAVIRDALIALRDQEEAAKAERSRQLVAAEHGALFGDKRDPFLGNPEADVTVVEFFDYRCGYCKQVAPALEKLVASDPKVRVVLKELPILGPQSEYAAKAALAARSEGKYLEFHRALIAAGDLSESGVRKIARQVGLDDKIFARLESSEVSEMLRQTAELAQRLQISGTPGLIVGDNLLPGSVSYENLASLVAAERARKP